MKRAFKTTSNTVLIQRKSLVYVERCADAAHVGSSAQKNTRVFFALRELCFEKRKYI